MKNPVNQMRKAEDTSLEHIIEGPIRKYLKIIKAFENIQPIKNKESFTNKGFKANIYAGEDMMRLFRTYEKEGENIIISDWLQDPFIRECIVRFFAKKDSTNNPDVTFLDASGDFTETLPLLVEKLETLVQKRGTKISFLPGTFEFDGESWKEIQ